MTQSLKIQDRKKILSKKNTNKTLKKKKKFKISKEVKPIDYPRMQRWFNIVNLFILVK